MRLFRTHKFLTLGQVVDLSGDPHWSGRVNSISCQLLALIRSGEIGLLKLDIQLPDSWQKELYYLRTPETDELVERFKLDREKLSRKLLEDLGYNVDK